MSRWALLNGSRMLDRFSLGHAIRRCLAIRMQLEALGKPGRSQLYHAPGISLGTMRERGLARRSDMRVYEVPLHRKIRLDASLSLSLEWVSRVSLAARENTLTCCICRVNVGIFWKSFQLCNGEIDRKFGRQADCAHKLRPLNENRIRDFAFRENRAYPPALAFNWCSHETKAFV